MSANAELHIIVPGVCGPLAEIETLKNSQIIKKWINTLSRSSWFPLSANLYDVISSILNLSVEGDFPSAALTMLANNMYDDSMYYMHADPVYLRADMDHAVLTSSADLDISENESMALCEALNQHFKEDGLVFFRLDKNKWFASSKNEIQIKTTPLPDAVARNVNFLLPQGKDSGKWKQVLTETQMLMHLHVVNIAREESARQTINSLWFHGAGQVSDINNARVSSICSNHDAFKGLAKYIECDYRVIPESASEYVSYLLSNKPESNQNNTVNVFHLSELEHLVNYTDVSIWSSKLEDVLNQWIYPLLTLAFKNNIKVTLYPCSGKYYQLSKYDILKFWRKGTLEQHVDCY